MERSVAIHLSGDTREAMGRLLNAEELRWCSLPMFLKIATIKRGSTFSISFGEHGCEHSSNVDVALVADETLALKFGFYLLIFIFGNRFEFWV
jgi:hypothetical protein